MNYEQALDAFKCGCTITRGSRLYILRRGVVDVTVPTEPKQHYFSEEDRAAEDWKIAAEAVVDSIDEPDESDNRNGDDHGPIDAPEVVAPEARS